MDAQAIGRMLIVVGGVIIIVGLVLAFGGRIPLVGQLPGDIVIEREGGRIAIPLVSMLVFSLILTIVINVALRLFR